MPTPFEALAGVANVCQVLPGVVTGGQPGAEQLARFRSAGGAIVLDIRDPMEPRALDEPTRARELGLAYVNIPVGPSALTDETLDRIRDVLNGAAGRSVFFHCASGNRVGGALIAHLILDHSFDEQDAVDQAMRVGLRSAELMEWGLDYARRKAAGS